MEDPEKVRQQDLYSALLPIRGYGYGKKTSIHKKPKKMQFTKIGQIMMSLNRRKALITNQKRAIKLQKDKNSQYQELLTDQLERNANI